MNRPALWLAALVSIAAVALMGSAADAQPKPITSCGTTVSAAGSYILNGNLTSTSTTSPCINVTANEVTIDLNGFVISGNGGTSTGISSSGTKLAVTDGTITGFGVGIYDPSAGSRISHLTVMNSAKDEHYGIYLGDSARVSDSILLNNGSDGIGVGANAVVTHCIFGGNGGYGLYAYSTGAVATENSAGANSEGGVDTSGKATVEGNAGTNNPSFNFADSGGATYDTNAAAGSSWRVSGAVRHLCRARFLAVACWLGTSLMATAYSGLWTQEGAPFGPTPLIQMASTASSLKKASVLTATRPTTTKWGSWLAVRSICWETPPKITPAARSLTPRRVVACITIWAFSRRAPQQRLVSRPPNMEEPFGGSRNEAS
jgi:hypothetical protein